MPLLEPNFNDTHWLATDRLRVISPMCLLELESGTGINAVVIFTEPHDYGHIKNGLFFFCFA